MTRKLHGLVAIVAAVLVGAIVGEMIRSGDVGPIAALAWLPAAIAAAYYPTHGRCSWRRNVG